MLHLHVGPSALALGLLIPMTLDAGFDVCVVGRPGEDNPKVFGVSGSGRGGRLSFREVNWFEGPHSVEDLPREVLARLGGLEPLLMTGSLREGIARRYEFMIGILECRPPEAETIVLPCENAPHSDYDKVRKACERTGALMLRTVVNRMCVDLGRDSHNRRTVSAHSLGEWLIERPPDGRSSAVLTALSQVDGFEVVSDIQARHDRKLWMVNGAHQALALMARRANADHRLEDGDDLRTALNPVTAARLGHLHNSMNEALRCVHPHLTASVEYSMEHVEAYAEHPESVARVLNAFRRLDLVPFIKALDERIAAPAKICHEHGLSVHPFTHVIAVFLELVANIDAFEDNIAVRSTRIDVVADIVTVARFDEMLRPWVGEKIDRQTAHFAQLLAGHREAFKF
jgi:hypothetical protein